MVRFLLMAILPEVSVMVQGQPLRLKLIVSPEVASVTTCRSEPAPLSLVFVTVSVTNGNADALAFTLGATCHSVRPSKRLRVKKVVVIRRYIMLILSLLGSRVR